jgi:hypothetical protein
MTDKASFHRDAPCREDAEPIWEENNMADDIDPKVEDVEGHKRAPMAVEDDDVAGHKRAPMAVEDDDVAGHKRAPMAVEDDDDVEGHKRTPM